MNLHIKGIKICGRKSHHPNSLIKDMGKSHIYKTWNDLH